MSNSPFQNVKAGAETAVADVTKALPVVEADAAKAKAEVLAVDSKLTAFIKNNAGKIAAGVLIGAALLVWHLI